MSSVLAGYLREPQAATAIGYSPGHLARLRRQGRGPAYCRRGNAIFYTTADLEAWLQKHRVDPEAS